MRSKPACSCYSPLLPPFTDLQNVNLIRPHAAQCQPTGAGNREQAGRQADRQLHINLTSNYRQMWAVWAVRPARCSRRDCCAPDNRANVREWSVNETETKKVRERERERESNDCLMGRRTRVASRLPIDCLMNGYTPRLAAKLPFQWHSTRQSAS